jgi:hypothetical protein
MAGGVGDVVVSDGLFLVGMILSFFLVSWILGLADVLMERCWFPLHISYNLLFAFEKFCELVCLPYE